MCSTAITHSISIESNIFTQLLSATLKLSTTALKPFLNNIVLLCGKNIVLLQVV